MYLVNQEKYIKRILSKLLDEYILNWLRGSDSRNSFNLSESVKYCGQHKMELIKYHIESLMEENSNLEYVYDRILQFKEFRDLLNYLSPHSYDTAESTLLEIIRNHSEIIITKHGKNDYYEYKVLNYEDEKSNIKAKISNLNIYFRSYIEIILDVKKDAYLLNDLYRFLLEEEIEHSLAKHHDSFLYFKNKKSYTVKETLKLLEGEEIKTPKEIFSDLISKDYHRFYRVIDNFYGLKSWSSQIKFDVYLRLFDKFWNNKNTEKYLELGEKVLELLPEKDFEKNKKKRLERNIKRILERG